jgi:hypothetical protein
MILKYGSGKDQYLTWNVVEIVVVSTCDSKNVRTIRRCVGFNKRSLRIVM